MSSNTGNTDYVMPPMRERPGFWRATGIALLVLAMPASIAVAAGLMVLVDTWWPDAVPRSALAWAVFCTVGSPMLIAGVTRINRARRMKAGMPNATAAPDTRRPVLFLRSFSDDERNAAPPDLAQINPFVVSTREENFVEALQAIGPVVAIGRPGELLPPLGAQRIYVDHVHWQEKVRTLMSEARLVVLALGASEGLWWEIEQALTRLPPARLLFHGAAKDFPAFLAQAHPWLPQPVSLPRLARLSLSPPEYLMFFDAHGAARFVRPGNSATLWRGDLKKPLLPIYRIALRPVFEQLGVPWTPPPIPWVPLIGFGGVLIVGFGALFWLALTQMN